MPFADRYRAAGITHNPFAAPRFGEPPASAFVDRGIPAPPPPGSKTLVQVIGPSGYGKSSQLAHWRGETPGPYHYIPRRPYSKRWATPPMARSGETVYGDEIDRMPAPLRRWWFRQLASKEATVIIGTHTDLQTLGEASGFSVRSHRLEPVDHQLMRAIVELRLDSARLPSIGQAAIELRFSDNDIERVVAASSGIPREADVWCHQILAEKVSVEDLTRDTGPRASI